MSKLEKSLYSASVATGIAGLLTGISMLFSICTVLGIAATMITAGRKK